MSWLGGSLSSLTGQLSNLTKDILTEGTEEVSDHVTELRLAQAKLQELDTVCTSQKIENDRLQLLIREWEEKAEGSELQINKISKEYRSLLEEKEGEIKRLKQQQHQQQELKSSYVSNDTHSALLQLEDDGFQSVGYGGGGGDEHDFGDYISMQRDINRLRGDNQALQAQCQHLKGLLEQNKGTQATDGAYSASEGGDSALHKQIQDLRHQLEQEKDTRQQELSSLQDAHAHKTATLRKKHKEEVAELKRRIQELDWGADGWEAQPSSSEADASLKQTVTKLQDEIAGLKTEREHHLQQISELGSTVEQQRAELSVQHAQTLHLENQLKLTKEEVVKLQEDKEKVGQDLFDTKQRLLDQLDANHADTLEVLSDLRQVRLHMDQSAAQRRNKLLLEKDKLVNEIISSGEKKKELAENIAKLESVQRTLAEETETIVSEIGDTESQEITADIVGTLEKENLLLREKNVSLQEQVGLLEKAMHNASKERLPGSRTISGDSAGLGGDELDVQSDTMSMTSDMSELSRRNLELDEEVINLKAQIHKYQTDIQQFEGLQAEWHSQRASLEEVLAELRGQMRTKEHNLSVLEAHKGLLAIEKHESSSSSARATDGGSSLEDIAEDVVELDSKIEQLTEANAQLEQERDFLVKEKVELQKELKAFRESEKSDQPHPEDHKEKLTNQLKEKEIELQALISEKEDLAKNLSEVPTLRQQLQQREAEVEELRSNMQTNTAEDLESMEKEIQDLQKKLRGKNEEIVNLSLEKQELMSSLEELDSQHEEAMGHIIVIKDQLSKANDELKSKLRISESETQELKSELEKMRNQHLVNQTVESSNSNELNHEIAELKEENAELRNDLERSESGAAKLEIENAHLEKKIKELNDKCLSSASALNDLHMSKKDLVDEIQKLKEELGNKSLKIKEMRLGMEDLKAQLAAGNDDKYSTDELEDEQKLKGAEEEYLKFQNDLEALEEKYLEAAEKCSQKELEIAKLKQELAAAQKDCKNLKEGSTRKHEELESFSRQWHSLESQMTSTANECKELKNENETLSSRVEMLNNELTIFKDNLTQKNAECELLNAELKETKDLLEDTTDKLHTKCEECNELSGEIEKNKHELSSSFKSRENEYEVKLMSATGETVLVKKELSTTTAELFAREEEINSLKQINEELQDTIKTLHTDIVKLKGDQTSDNEVLNDYKAKLAESEIHNEVIQSEINKLKNDLSEVSQKLTSQSQHYEAYIEELKSQRDSDDSSLHKQYDEAVEKCHKKDLALTEMKTALADTEFRLNEAKSNTEKIQLLCDTKDKEISELKTITEGLKSSNDTLSIQLKETCKAYDALKERMVVCENELKQSKQAEQEAQTFELEKANLTKRISELQLEVDTVTDQRKAQQVECEKLSLEVSKLQEKVHQLEYEIGNYKDINEAQDATIAELTQEKTEALKNSQESREVVKSQTDTIEHLKRSDHEKHEEISQLKQKLLQNSDSLKTVENKSGDTIELVEVNEQMEMVRTENKLGTVYSNSDNDLESSRNDISVEIDNLREKLSEKDKVISDMQKNNDSLLKMLDSKSKSSPGDATIVEIHRLEKEVKSLKIEKEQMIDVLNEKSRESSSLKAEVQKLMNIVSAEKAALQKLQQDNNELTKNTPENGEHISDMQKEVVQNLSRIIRDKDLEIESLTQKNQTLLSVLQESSNEDSHLHSLMQDKENLTKQIHALQGEREQMIAYLNQKHQESVAYHTEVQRLTALMNSENEKNDRMKQEYESLMPLFEDKKQALLLVQNELIDYKQRYTDLEVKYGQLLQESNSEGTVDKAVFESKVQEAKRLQERYKELIDTVKEKETKIQSLHQNVSELEQQLRTVESEKSSFKKQVDSFTFQVHGLQTDQSEKIAELAQLKQQKNELSSELQLMREMNNKLTLQIQDKEFEIKSLQRSKSSTSVTSSPDVSGSEGVGNDTVRQEKGQVDELVREVEAGQRFVKQVQLERDQAVMALHQAQEQNNTHVKEIQTLQQKEAKMNRELQRLRQHLIQIEDGYTKEALAAEEREKDLRVRLASAEEKALASSSAVESFNQQTSQQLDSLQQQLAFVSQQRDQAYLQISTLQEQCQNYTVSMANLQMVLEEFQEEKEKMVSQETEKLEKECASLKTQVQKLTTELKSTKEQLDSASDGLEAAARLSEQLDRKEEALDALKEEVLIREATLKHVEEELHKLKSRSDDKVDKVVIKNLFLGYFTTPANQQREVLHAIGGVLLFTSEDFEKIEGRGRPSWVPGFLKFGGGQHPSSNPSSPPTTPVRRQTIATTPGPRKADNSFSEMFVRFLERESSPPPPTVRLPAEDMVRDVQKQKEKPAYNPFTAPRQVAAPPSSSTSTSSSHSSQHILMSSAMSMPQTIPTFAAPSEAKMTPPGSGRNTPASTSSGAFLKDVLNNR